MPSSTTLETLVLEINSSAVKANEGIGRTIGSLRSLSKAVGTVLPGLREMNRELLRTSRIKMPNIGGSITRGAGRTSKALTTEEIRAWQAQSRPTITNNLGAANMIPDSELRRLHPEWYTTESQRAANALANARPGGQASWVQDTKQAVVGFNQVANAQERCASASRAVKRAASEAKAGINEVGNTAEKNKQKVSGFSKGMSTVSRIFKTMLIRTVIRNMIKAFGEAWNAAYEFSRKMGGSFATAVDRAKTMLTDIGVSLVQTIAPLFEALVPVLKVVTDAIQYLCQGIQDLFRWLGLVSDVTNANTASIGKYTNAAGKGGKATKNMLASWDQLNVIQSKGGSGNSGASYKPGSLKNIVSTETGAIMQMVVGESMLAIGLILACTGHIGLGIGAIAIGAAAIVKTLTVDWKKLPDNVKNSISTIMTVAGVSMLALGLMVCGANLPLGIGMIIAGAANLGIAAALNWDGIVERLNGVMADIGAFFVNTWTDIKSAIGRAWGAVSRWWTDNISTPIANAWNSVSTFFVNLWGSAEDGTGIAGWASNAWKDVSTWWETNVLENIEKEGVWGGVKGFFKGIWGSAEDGTGIAGMANNAWTTVNQWMDSAIGTNFEKEWGKVKPIFESIFGTEDDPTSISGMVYDSFQDVSRWWKTNVSDKVKEEGAWGGVKGFFQGIFTGEDGKGGILGLFNTMWSGISQFWATNVTKPIEDAWSNIATWFQTNVTRPVSDFFTNMINRLIDGLNWLIDCLNSVGHIKFGEIDLGILGKFPGIDKKLFEIPHVEYVAFGANGLYDVPKGDLFVANEAGAELVGSMNGKTTVANQGQIIEGIQKGVRDANADQNDLLRQQNDLLRQILRKKTEFNPRPSAAWGQFISESNDLWTGMTGG